jgi:seryl-tRNA synthetase
MRIPNLTHPDAPIGQTEESNAELRRVGTPRTFDFTPRDHVEIGKALDLIDFEAGAKVSGHGFYFLRNDAVLLDLALQSYALEVLIRRGFTPITTPDLARDRILEGIGFSPRGPETQVYAVEDSDLCLIGTAEITLGGMLADEVLDEEQLPTKYVGLSHCFRTEAGAGGRASKGLYRVHQFTKIEMFAFTTPEASGAMHAEMLAIEEELFGGLGLPYRVLDICSGDLGGPAYRKYDIEAWMPGRGEAGEYGEVTSTSDCTDYQSRRLNIRYRPTGQKGTRFVHTLNGTAIAISRAIIAILENYQQADGSVLIPEVLQSRMGKRVITPRARQQESVTPQN